MVFDESKLINVYETSGAVGLSKLGLSKTQIIAYMQIYYGNWLDTVGNLKKIVPLKWTIADFMDAAKEISEKVGKYSELSYEEYPPEYISKLKKLF